jgi:hypothetical protein
MSRTNQIIFHNDATSCYDRIIINLANLLARRFGMSKELCRIHGDTLHHMLYYVSTALGISDRWYQNLPDQPIHGTGQGSCASPAVWLIICSTLFDCHQKASHGAEYFTPDDTIKIKLSMAGFVDDTKGQINDMRNTKPMTNEMLMSRMQDDAQLWGDLLHVSGGALEIPKCNYYIMKWKFDDKGAPELDKTVKMKMQLAAGDGTKVTLTNDSVGEAHKTLGTWKSALRTQKKQYSVLLDKNNEYARVILSSAVSTRENWTAYYGVFMQRNTFVLPTCYFSKDQLDNLERRAVSATLAKGGYCSKMPRDVTNGPQRYGGLGMRPLWVEQLVSQTQTVIKHIRCPGDCNLMLRIALAWAQLSTGMGFALLEHPGLAAPHLECKWLTSMRWGLATIDGSIECAESFVVPPAREGDIYLMDAICDCRRFTGGQIKQINACRLYLQVLLLSDITTPCGTFIAMNYHTGNRNNRSNWPRIRYPRQQKPKVTAWKLWRKAINLLYLEEDKKTLQRPLGRWGLRHPNHHQWESIVSGDKLYKATEKSSTYRCSSSIAVTRRITRYATAAEPVREIPISGQPITIQSTTTGHEVQNEDVMPIEEVEISTPDSIYDRIAKQPTSHQELLQNIELSMDEIELATTLAEKAPVWLASDGGAVPGRGSYGWVLRVGQRIIARGKGPAHGPDPRSFRAEGYGMASGLLFLQLLVQHYHIDWTNDNGNKIICDNEGLLIRIEATLGWAYLQPNVTLRAEWDIESVIITTYNAIGWKFSFEHVRSHQDKAIPVDDLPEEVQLNVEADRLATEFLEDSEYQGRAGLFPSAKCQLLLGGETVTRKVPNAIRFQAGAGPIRKYLMKRNQWCETTLDSIDWMAHGAAHSYHRTHQSFLIKLCHRHLPLGRTLHRRDNKYPATCPVCGDETETHDHFVGCKGTTRIKWRTDTLTAIRKQMEKTKTDTNLSEAIINVMDRAMAGRPISVHGPFEMALRAQERIGWRGMFQGHWAMEWQLTYRATYTTPAEEDEDAKSKRNTNMDRWLEQLIRSTWTAMIALWGLRNGERHGRDEESREKARHTVLTNELERLYINRDQYPAEVQKLLRNSFSDHCRDKASAIEDWLSAFRVTFQVMHIRPSG